jgi:hypothetical protein
VHRNEHDAPGCKREHFLHETAKETADRADRDDQKDNIIEAGHTRRLGPAHHPVNEIWQQPDRRKAQALHLFRRAIGPVDRREAQLGRSRRRTPAWATGRLPRRATSPNHAVSEGSGRSASAETSAAATARSAAGSVRR